jgi:cytosine/adenosine deaminase-related metal-dependent hydrolase
MTGPQYAPINTTPKLLRELRRFADESFAGHQRPRRRIEIGGAGCEHKSTREQRRRGGFLLQFDIRRPNSIFAHSVHVSEKEIGILRETRHVRFSQSRQQHDAWRRDCADRRNASPGGQRWFSARTGAASNHSQDLFETMKAASLLQKVHHQDAGVIDPFSVLPYGNPPWRQSAWSRVCLRNRVEVGKRADLILIDIDTVHNQPVNDIFSQLVHCAKASDVQNRDGRWRDIDARPATSADR